MRVCPRPVPMFTFKQLEALHWVVSAGGFSQAAHKLHTTQSTVSKRVQELEALLGTPLFDRTLRTARLTEAGEELAQVAARLLEQREAALQRLARPEVATRRLRIGVTELTAMTWLPRLVSLLRAHDPRLVIEPDVDASTTLRDKLLADTLDLIIVPDMIEDARLRTTVVGKVRNAWMCKPGLLDPRKPLRLHDLAAHRMLSEGERSGTGLLYERWFKSLGITPANTIISSNLVAMIGLTASGLGVSHLPRDCLAPMVDAGLLSVLRVSPVLPDVTYVAACRAGPRSSLVDAVVRLARESCDFRRAFQTG